MTTPDWLKPAVWGGVVGAVGMLVVAFGMGWIVTAGGAEEQAQLEADRAVVAALTPVCVEQFRELADAQQETHIAALQEESSWGRETYVEDQGWATLPGAEDPNDAVAEACAERLMEAAEA